MLPGVRRTAGLGPVLAHDAGYKQPPVLEVVRRRASQRVATTAWTATLRRMPNKAAFIWVPEAETEETRTITYRDLYGRVNEFAAMLRGFCGLEQR